LAFLGTSTGIVDDTLTNPCGTGTQPPSKRVWTSLELAKLPLDPVTARRVWLEEVANEHEIDRRKFEQELKAQQRRIWNLKQIGLRRCSSISTRSSRYAPGGRVRTRTCPDHLYQG
jgi:hypothetical protein